MAVRIRKLESGDTERCTAVAERAFREGTLFFAPCQDAMERAIRALCLNTSNEKNRAFYHKNHFEEVGTASLRVGKALVSDWSFRLELSGERDQWRGGRLIGERRPDQWIRSKIQV